MSMLANNQKGFVIIFAVLISALMLLIGVGIFRISVKETVLSSTARESTIAFFAADGGMECTLQAINVEGKFRATTPSMLTCGEEEASYNPNPNLESEVRGLKLPQGCARIEVELNHDGGLYTLIRSHGYNVCDSEGMPDTENPLLLERVLELKYPNATG